MREPQIVFRVDASATIGSGHVMRCLTLAERLKHRGGKILFVSRAADGDLISEIGKRGYQILTLPKLGEEDFASAQEADAIAFLKSLDSVSEEFPAVHAVDWIIVDSYALGCIWEKAVRPRTAALMAIDDLANRPHDVDILLDQNLVQGLENRYDNLVDASCMRLLGPRYALLANSYSLLSPQLVRLPKKTERLLVYFGAADTRMTFMCAQGLTCLPHFFKATIVLNESNTQYHAIKQIAESDNRIELIGGLPNLAAAMVDSDLFIGASGTTSWERLCLGLNAIVVTVADNQIPLAAELARHGFIRWLGDANAVDANRIAVAAGEALSVPVDCQLAEKMMAVVDGKGADRVCDALLYDGREGVFLRPVTGADSDLLLTWANNPGTRRYAFSPGAINPHEHKDWFYKRLNNPNVIFLIAETPNALPFGQVRFERQSDGSWEISYLVAPGFRGRGLARKLLSGALEHLKQLYSSSTVTGRVKNENKASMRVFTALGFTAQRLANGVTKFILPL